MRYLGLLAVAVLACYTLINAIANKHAFSFDWTFAGLAAGLLIAAIFHMIEGRIPPPQGPLK